MRIVSNFRCLPLIFVLVLFAMGRVYGQDGNAERNGALVVLVTWGDVSRTPANDVYIDAHGFVRKYNSEKSFVLKMSGVGRYEASVPPAVYDVFVSEGTSAPASVS